MMQIKEKINKNNIYNISFILLIILLAIVNKISVIPDNTKWQANHNSNIRVILSEVIDNKLLIGLNIKLDKDSYTYWKNPGDTGLEPSIKIEMESNNDIKKSGSIKFMILKFLCFLL